MNVQYKLNFHFLPLLFFYQHGGAWYSSSCHTRWLKEACPRIIHNSLASKAAPAWCILPWPSIISTGGMAGKESPASNPLIFLTSPVLGAGSPQSCCCGSYCQSPCICISFKNIWIQEEGKSSVSFMLSATRNSNYFRGIR